MKRALRVGVTGKMGSGKSTFCRLLRQEGWEVLESDVLAKEIMTHDHVVRGEIAALLGSEAYHGEELNRAFIAKEIFSDPMKRIALESIVHPRVTVAMNLRFQHAKPGEIIALESALILQTDLWLQFDYVIVIEASDEVVIKRLREGGRFTEEDARARLREQSATPIATDEIDFSIDNNLTEKEFEQTCQFFVTLLPELAARELPDLPMHQVYLDLGDEPSEN